jgi:hypothetical protein
VETGPVVAFHRSVYELVFPFDVTSPEGLGYECVWSYRLAERGWKMGIIDAVPIRVVTDAGASPYWRRDSVGRDLYLRRNRHYPLGSAMRTLAIFGFDEHLSWTGPG